MMTYQRSFVSRYSRISSILETDTIMAQHAHREVSHRSHRGHTEITEGVSLTSLVSHTERSVSGHTEVTERGQSMVRQRSQGGVSLRSHRGHTEGSRRHRDAAANKMATCVGQLTCATCRVCPLPLLSTSDIRHSVIQWFKCRVVPLCHRRSVTEISEARGSLKANGSGARS